jgi:Tat protein translocase TatB subunit
LFGVGGPELIVIVVVALIFIGPDKFPKVARSIGSGLRDLRRVTSAAQAEFKETVDDLVREADLESALQLDEGHSSARDKGSHSTKEADSLIRKHPDSGFHFDDDDEPGDDMPVDGQECAEGEAEEDTPATAPDFASMLHSEKGPDTPPAAPSPDAEPRPPEPETTA